MVNSTPWSYYPLIEQRYPFNRRLDEPRDSMDVLESRGVSCSYRDSNCRPSRPIQLIYRLHHPTSCLSILQYTVSLHESLLVGPSLSMCYQIPRFSACIYRLNAEIDPICHLLALLVAHHILHASRRRVKEWSLQRQHKSFLIKMWFRRCKRYTKLKVISI